MEGAGVFEPSLEADQLDSIDEDEEESGNDKARPVLAARPAAGEGRGVATLSNSSKLSAEELQVESDLRARLNELLVLTKEGTVDAVAGLGGQLFARDSGINGGLQAGEQRVRAHRQSVYGLTREPPPWAVKPGTPTTSAKIASFTQRVGQIRRGNKLTAEEVVGGRQLHSKVAIITGANTGIGYESARVLCKAGARVILACRNVKSAEAAADKIRLELEGAAATTVKIVHDSEWVGANYTDIGTVEVMELDLADLDSVRSFAAKFLAEDCPLHYLICNAGKMAPPFRLTKQCYETQWAVNHLGHFLLSSLLSEKLDETAGRSKDGSRLVVLTSQSHQLGKMHWDKGFLNAQESYDPWAAYFQSKLANVLFVREFDRLSAQRSAEKHGKDATCPRTTAHAVNPGLTNTSITRELSPFAKAAYFGGMSRRSSALGAATTLYCCVNTVPDLVLGGRYYENCEDVLLWDDVTCDDEEDAKKDQNGVHSGEFIEECANESDVEDETSLEAAARLWALSEWMVQPNSTYHDAHDGLFNIDETQEEESFERVFDYDVETPAITNNSSSDRGATSDTFGEAAGEWQEAQFDPTAAQLAAVQAAAARKSASRVKSSSRRQRTELPRDDGVELAELSPAAEVGTPRRAAVLHTPVIETIDPFARLTPTIAENTTKNSTVVAATGNSAEVPGSTTRTVANNVSISDDEQGRSQSQSTMSESSEPQKDTESEELARTQTTQQRMAWSALSDEERRAAVELGWDSDGVSWEQGGRPNAWTKTPALDGGDTGGIYDGIMASNSSLREWRKLSPAEQAAGLMLGFDQVSWDTEMAPEVAEAKAKAKAAADEAAELAMLARAAKEDAELAREKRRAETAKKEKARAARKAKVAAAKAQRKALKDAEEKQRLAADTAQKAREQREAEKSKLETQIPPPAKGESSPTGSMTLTSGTSQSRSIDADQAAVEVPQRQPRATSELDERKEPEQLASPAREEAEAAVEAQAKAAFAALAAAVAAGPSGDTTSSDGTPIRTPGRSRSSQREQDLPPSPSGSPAKQKEHAMVAAKADYFFGQAMKLHDEFAAIEGRTGARKLSYFEAAALAEDLGLSLSGPTLNAALPTLDPGRSGEIRFADFEEWWKGASLKAGNGKDSAGTTAVAGTGAKSGASKNSLGSAIALALAEEGGFVE